MVIGLELVGLRTMQGWYTKLMAAEQDMSRINTRAQESCCSLTNIVYSEDLFHWQIDCT